jgi:hypothetical protein
MNKEPKNRQELTRMIMKQIRQRPEWNDVVPVAIIVERNRTASHLPNWDAAFTVEAVWSPFWLPLVFRRQVSYFPTPLRGSLLE